LKKNEKKGKEEDLTGIAEIGQIMLCKRIRWAASVYGRHLPELREMFRAPRESADSRVAWFAGGPGRAGDEFILAGSPGPAGASYLLTIFFFLKSQIPT